jgi:uncharacterized protein (TIGR02147 family)
MGKRPNVFSYSDFRRYLADIFEYEHDLDKSFNKAFVCRELGLPNTRSYFRDVLTGKIVSDVKIPLFIRLFGLNSDEAPYFRVLVKFNQCEEPDEKEMLFDQLVALNRTPHKEISAKGYVYFKEWHHSVIKALLEVIDFTDDYAGLGMMVVPPLKPHQVKESIQLLLELGLVAKNRNKFLKPTDKVIATGPFSQSDIVKQYQIKSLDVVRATFFRNGNQPKRIMTKTISISQEGLARIIKKMEKFSSEVRSIVHKDEKKADCVYQLMIILNPQGRK